MRKADAEKADTPEQKPEPKRKRTKRAASGETSSSTTGRPRLDIDPTEVEKLAMIHCTMEEIAAVVNCSVDTLERRFAEVIKRGRENGKASLRRMQYLSAQKGNVAMMIWLGKQLLGQRERADIDMSTGLTVVWDDRLGKL